MTHDEHIELPRETRKSHTIHIPVTEQQYRDLKDMAEERCTSVAELLRAACHHAGLFGRRGRQGDREATP